MIMTKILPGLLGVFACASISLAAGPDLTLSKANELAVEKYAKQYIAHREGKHILKGILWVESKYGKYKSGKGSYGIAQIEIPTARYVAKKFGFKIPRSNGGIKEMLMRDDRMSIRIAAAYLGLLEKRFGSLDHVIVAYNLGPTKLSGIARNGRKVTTEYLAKVMEITRSNKGSLRFSKAVPPRSLSPVAGRKPSNPEPPLSESLIEKKAAPDNRSIALPGSQHFYWQDYCDETPRDFGAVTEALSHQDGLGGQNALLDERVLCELASSVGGGAGGPGRRA